MKTHIVDSQDELTRIAKQIGLEHPSKRWINQDEQDEFSYPGFECEGLYQQTNDAYELIYKHGDKALQDDQNLYYFN